MTRIKALFLTISIGISSLVSAQEYKRTVINDPSISRRCELLTEERQSKLEQKLRIMALIERNKRLQKITPENKKTIKRKLEINLGHLEHELSLTLNQIQFHEESIIRKGCPGINL